MSTVDFDLWWPLFLSLGLALFVFSFLITEATAAVVLRVLSFALLVVSAICTVSGLN